MCPQNLSKVVRFITSPDPLQHDGRLLVQQIFRKIGTIQGLSAVIYLLEIRKIASSRERLGKLRKVLRNSTSVVLVSTLYPVLRKLLPARISRHSVFLWCSTVLSSLLAIRNVPNWLVSYVTVEALSDRLSSVDSIKHLVAQMDESTLVLSRQAALCAIVPLLYLKSGGKSNASGAGRILFSKRSILLDFMIFYSIWNFLSLYNFCKSLILRTKKSRTDFTSKSLPHFPDDWSIRSSNMKPIMDRLTEIHEITFQNSYSVFEKLMNSSIIKNIFPSFKWALWRHVCYKSLTHVPRSSHSSAAYSKLMQSITMMLAFFVLDGRENKMNVRPGVIRYLIRCLLSRYSKNLGQPALKSQLFIMSQLAFCNTESGAASP